MRFVCTLRGKPLGLNSAFRSGRDSMTDLNLDVHMVAASRKTDRWKVPICVELRRRWCLHTLREACEDLAGYEAYCAGRIRRVATTWNVFV